MSIQLAPSIEARINERVERGHYPDADSVVDAALRLLDARDEGATLDGLLHVALDQAARGEVIEMTDDFWPRFKRKAKEATRRGDPISDHVKPEAASFGCGGRRSPGDIRLLDARVGRAPGGPLHSATR